MYQYSAREVGHPHLFIQQLRRAHSIFLLLHDFALGSLYERVGRASFCLFLERFWEKFAWNWELLLGGNPIVDVYNGIKLAAGGELGIGVGEEEWGSGEREVLEDFVTRTDGLVDIVVSRFGESVGQSDSPSDPESKGETPWLGQDIDPQPADGVIFSGVNSISRHSVARVSHWMEWIYRYGDTTYGVGRDPTSLRRRKPRRNRGRIRSEGKGSRSRSNNPQPADLERAHTPGIPRPLVLATPQTIPESQGSASEQNEVSTSNDSKNETSVFASEAVMKYLTLGYGSSWSLSSLSTTSPTGSTAAAEAPKTSTSNVEQNKAVDLLQKSSKNDHDEARAKLNNVMPGRFVLGPRDDLDTLDDLEEASPVPGPESEASKPSTRIVNRTLHLQLANPSISDRPRKLQAVVYVVSTEHSCP